MRIVVVSTYDVTPGQNGGEARFLALYSRLAVDHDVCILSYDHRRGESVRHTRLGPRFDVLTYGPRDEDWLTLVEGNVYLDRFLHDIFCISTYQFSSAFIAAVKHTLAWADVVVVTTPFLAPVVFPLCKSTHLKVHETHNVEADAKEKYLFNVRDQAMADTLLEETRRAEAYALGECDIATAVSDGDKERFIELYDCPASKIEVVSNGVSCEGYDSISLATKKAFREQFADKGPVATFMGSSYGPNLESYNVARDWLNGAGFRGTVLLLGGMLDARNENSSAVGFNERWLGFVDQKVKELILSSSDFALQIVTTGGGTNLKVFDYMAAGRPIIANSFGSRGIEDTDWYLKADNEHDLRQLLAKEEWNGLKGKHAAQRSREIVSALFDWDVIAAGYASVLTGERREEMINVSEVSGVRKQ